MGPDLAGPKGLGKAAVCLWLGVLGEAAWGRVGGTYEGA